VKAAIFRIRRKPKGFGGNPSPQAVVPVGLLLSITRPLNASSFTEPMGDEELLLLL